MALFLRLLAKVALFALAFSEPNCQNGCTEEIDFDEGPDAAVSLLQTKARQVARIAPPPAGEGRSPLDELSSRALASHMVETQQTQKRDLEQDTWARTTPLHEAATAKGNASAVPLPSVVPSMAPMRPATLHGNGDKKLAEAAIPISGILMGAVLAASEQRTVGMLFVYFGAQAGFGLYMKEVLSSAVVSEELRMKGVPAGFLVTAIQQVVAFVVLAAMLCVLAFTPRAYMPRRLTKPSEWLAVICFAFAFAVNIGLNNFSLSLLAISLNLIIRSCLPLVTLGIQQLLGGFFGGMGATKTSRTEVCLMTLGVICAGVATWAKAGSFAAVPMGATERHMLLGVLMVSLSDVAAALTMVIAGAFGSAMSPPLNPLDTMFYMALPAAIFLIPAATLGHPVDWPGGPLSDFQVIQKVMELSPSTMWYVILSGVFAAAYNVLQFAVVQHLSATHAAFAGNFNKAATILLSITLGLETLPGGHGSIVMLLAIGGNIAAFTAYSLLKTGNHQPHSASSSSSDSAEKPMIH